MSHMVGMPVISFLDMMTHPADYAISLFILTTIVLILGKDIIKNGYKNLIHKIPNMDTLVSIGVNDRSSIKLYLQHIWNNSNFKRARNACRKPIL